MISKQLIETARKGNTSAFNEVCMCAIDQGWCAEVDEYAMNATNVETIDFIVKKMQVASMEEKINNDNDVYDAIDWGLNNLCKYNGLDASEYEFTIKLKEI